MNRRQSVWTSMTVQCGLVQKRNRRTSLSSWMVWTSNSRVSNVAPPSKRFLQQGFPTNNHRTLRPCQPKIQTCVRRHGTSRQCFPPGRRNVRSVAPGQLCACMAANDTCDGTPVTRREGPILAKESTVRRCAQWQAVIDAKGLAEL